MLYSVAAAALLLMMLFPALVAGQAQFHEDFEDIGPPSYSTPSSLVQRGWIFRNQSQPAGSRGYFSGITWYINEIYFLAQDGDRYLAVDGQAANGQGMMSVWAILPPVTNQQAGDPISLWARRLAGDAGFEIRYSPSGGTGTGVSVMDVGDFTEVLVSVPSANSNGWERYDTAVPASGGGAGRLAIRVRGQAEFGAPLSYVGIDTLSVGTPPAPACNQPVIPRSGETVLWTAAGGPYRICQNVSIPQGATVNIEAGAEVYLEPQNSLLVTGTLNINGTAEAPVTMTRSSAPGSAFLTSMSVVGSEAEINATYARFETDLHIAEGSTNAALVDCTFAGTSLGVSGAYIEMERCTVEGGYFGLNSAAAVVRDCVFDDTQNFLFYGYTDFQGTNVFDGRPLRMVGSSHIVLHPYSISNVHVRNVGDGAGLQIDEPFYLGENVVLEDNLYPVSIMGPILPGSSVPTAGNINNVIDALDAFMVENARWMDFGIPYRLTVPNNPQGPAAARSIFPDPGVIIEHMPGTFMVALHSTVNLRGTPELPIRLIPAPGFGTHHGPIYWSASNNRIEYAVLEKMQNGVIGTAATLPLWIENSIIRNSAVGVDMRGIAAARVAGTQFVNNGIGAKGDVELNRRTHGGLGQGAQPSPSHEPANSFVGNTVAVFGSSEWQSDARNVWWNSPTGPQHPANPGGTGEVVGGETGNVSVVPFLTSPPDHSTHPPIVRALLHEGAEANQMVHLGGGIPTTMPGTKYFLQWQAVDTPPHAPIVSQKIVMYWVPPGMGLQQEMVIADDLPPDQRTFELTIPDVGFQLNLPLRLVISATDDRGRIGWDQVFLTIPEAPILPPAGTFVFDDSPWVGRTFHPREAPPVARSYFTNTYPWEMGIGVSYQYESDHMRSDPHYVSQQYGYFDMAPFPYISTDRARLVFSIGNERFYGRYFSIRPDPRLGWEPPQVEMTSPVHGAEIGGGTSIPIAWTASAQQGLYSFDIQASYDGGGVWHTVVAQLPAEARGFDWKIPASEGLADLRLRVIARDKRMQNSADGDDHIITILPGPGSCYANCDQSTVAPVLNVDDFTCFINEFAQAQSLPHAGQVSHYANCDGSTVAPALNVDDFTCFINQYAAGCP